MMNALSRLTVNLAYALQASHDYQRTKRFFYNLLENANFPYKRIFDYVMIALIFSSVFILIREVKHHVNDELLFFNNYVISLIFLGEYLLRMWIYSDTSKIIIAQYEGDEFLQRNFRLRTAIWKAVRTKLLYMRSPAAVVDLLAIVPFFHELRLLRIFILFRVFKLFRYANSLKQLLSVLSTKKFELLTLMAFATVIIFVSGVLIYVMEANNPDSSINTLFEAFYWALVTISTVGFGDLVPVSEEGRAVAMVIIICGIAVISFVTSIVVSAFTERMDEIKEQKVIGDVMKLENFYLICGYSDVAQQVASKLRRNGHQVVLLDRDAEAVKAAQLHQLIAIEYDPGSLQSYRKLEINFAKQVKAVLCLKEDDVKNIYTALTIRAISKEIRVLSILIKEQNRKKLTLAGVDEVVYTQELIGLFARELSGRPVAFEAIHALRSEQSGVSIEEMLIDERIAKNFKSVEMLQMSRFRLMLMGVFKTEEARFIFNPPHEYAIVSGDVLLIIGTNELIGEFKRSLHKKSWL